MSGFKILALGGDGIGPEVLASGLELLDAVSALESLKLQITEDLLHGAAWDRYGTFCRDETLTEAKNSDAILVGAVGGPKWDDIRVPGGPEMQDGLMRLRKELDCYLGLRPSKAISCLEDLTPFRSGLCRGADILVLREICGGAVFGEPRGIEVTSDGKRRGFDNAAYGEDEIARFAGHRNLSVTQQYVHLSGRDLAQKLENGMAQIHEWRVQQLATVAVPEVSR